MSSGAHLSKELHDLIKSIGQTRSQQEEDKIIIQQQTKLKTKIQDTGISPQKMREHMIRSIYIQMLGHDASFSHIHAVNLTQSKALALKRIGYLCCSLFLNESSQFLILLVANLQRDLQSTSIHEVVIALTALGKLISPMMIGGVIDPLTKLLTHTTDLVRKKAVIVLHRIYRISNVGGVNTYTIPDFNDQLHRALCDKEPSVMAAALNPYYEVIKANTNAYKNLCPSFVLILKQVIEHQLTRDYDYHRMPAPWVQIKILQILAMFGANDLRTSEQIYEVLGMTLKRSDDTGINIGNAVTYQCVKTIATIYPNQQLLESAATAVSKFLTSDYNNLKYHGINALIQIVQVDPKYVLDHSLTILDCLQSKDETMKKQTLMLLSKMANNTNCQGIVEKLLLFLKSTSEQHFRSDLVNQVTIISEKFAPSQEWFIQTMNTVFQFGGEFVSSDIINNFLRLIEDNFNESGEEFCIFMISTYLEILDSPTLSDIMTQIIAWVMGEIGSAFYGSDDEMIRKIVTKLLSVITNDFEDESPRNWILNALAKLSSCPSFQMRDQLKACFDFYGRSQSLQVSQRCTDYRRLAQYNAALRASSSIKLSFDPTLSFLQDFVAKSGGQTYDESKSSKSHYGNSSAVDPQAPHELYFDIRQAPVGSGGTLKPGGAGPVNLKDDEVKLKVAKDKWTSEGVKPEDDTNKFTLPNKGANVTAIGSGGETQTTSNMKSISSEDYKGAPQNISIVNNGSTGIQNQTGPTAYQKKIQEQNEQKKKEKLQQAQAIFGGITNVSTTNVSTTKPVIQPYATNTNPPQVGGGYPGTSASPSTGGEINLLDLDSGSSTTKPNIVIAPTQAPAPGGPPSLFSFGPPFTPYKIDVGTYENFWSQLKIEKAETFSSKVQSENDFKNLLNVLQIGIVEIISNQIICAGQNKKSDQVVLLYGVYNSNGQLDITAKANAQDDINFIINTIQQKFC